MNNFKLFYLASGEVVLPEIGKFPGGEIRVRLPAINGVDIVRIEALLFNSDDIMTLVMIVDALREMGTKHIRLTMPYIPYARQDRVCNEGEAFSIRAFAKIINSLEFASVLVYDPHSSVSVKLIDRCIAVPQEELIAAHKQLSNWITRDNTSNRPTYLLCPDKGAVKKTNAIAEVFPQFKAIIYAEKVRDLATGKIIRTEINDVPADIKEARVLIADDICDGGRTFVELANWFTDGKEDLRPYELNLYVTHGIFSQGMEVLYSQFNEVWCTINFKDYQ